MYGMAVNLAAKLASFDDHFAPRIVAEFNDHKIELVKVKGEFVWHAHPETDEVFLVLDGQLTMQLRDRSVALGPGDLYVVPRGVEHCPTASSEAQVLLIEPMGTPNTGTAGGDRTAVERRI